MVDMGSIAAALGGLKTAADIAKGLLALKSDAERQAKVIELQTVILAAQSSAIAAQSDQFTMLEEMRQLRDEIAKVRAWETQKQRYKMAVPFPGVTVYALLRSMSNGEPPHYICANCYQDGKRSMLQHNTTKNNWPALACAACKFEGRMPYAGGIGPDKYAEDVTTEW
jgi:hypothetical protein